MFSKFKNIRVEYPKTKGFVADLETIHKDPKKRFGLYKEVFNTDAGKLLLAYMEDMYCGQPDLNSDNRTYFNLGMREVIRQIKTIITKK
jgi:hypothetical protein